jgi:DNA-binding NtrC family response regulator
MPDDRGWIAIVEDDPIMGESLQRALELEGWRTSWWRTGKEAARLVQECSPDLVLCDIRLGDMTGEEVFRVASSSSPAPPFIFMTAYGQIDQAVSLMRAGACDYLTKPFDLDSLLFKVREIISLRPRDMSEGALGISPTMQKIETMLRRMATRPMMVWTAPARHLAQ